VNVGRADPVVLRKVALKFRGYRGIIDVTGGAFLSRG
jgi:hypothetical protein